MARVALVIANSVTSQVSLTAPRPGKVLRAALRLNDLLQELPQDFAFESSYESNATPERVQQAARKAAKRCRGPRGLLVIYYFGHGRRQSDGLSFVHPGRKTGSKEDLSFSALLHSVLSGSPNNVLFLLDCCYAGASEASIDLLPESERRRCCAIACTSASTRAYWDGDDDSPIGFFTSALLDGLLLGTVSPTNDAITAESLFRFVKDETKRLTNGKQEPYIVGHVDQEVSRYSHNPVIVRGISRDVSEKSAYHKLIAILKTIGDRTYKSLPQMYERVLVGHRDAFLTNFVDEDRRISQRPAKWPVLRRYISFLRAIRAVDEAELRLTPRGSALLVGIDDLYNTKLRDLLTQYLDRQRGLTIDDLRRTIQRVMERRWLPTREYVLNELFLEKGYHINEQHLALVLDLFGCIGVIGTLRKRQQVYFPWNEHPSRLQRVK